MSRIAESELVLNSDGSVYHLRLQPDELARDIIVVGDPGNILTGLKFSVRTVKSAHIPVTSEIKD